MNDVFRGIRLVTSGAVEVCVQSMVVITMLVSRNRRHRGFPAVLPCHYDLSDDEPWHIVGSLELLEATLHSRERAQQKNSWGLQALVAWVGSLFGMKNAHCCYCRRISIAPPPTEMKDFVHRYDSDDDALCTFPNEEPMHSPESMMTFYYENKL